MILISAFPMISAADQHAGMQKQIDELKAKLDSLSNNMGTQQTARDLKEGSHMGLGEAASKVYKIDSGLSIGGYGEIVWRKISGDSTTANNGLTTDIYRFVPYIGYRFNDKIVLNSELEIEHGGSVDGKVIVEFMYIDYNFWKDYGVRIGNLLIPSGLVNQLHEPIYFPMVDRPRTERYLIPSTWHENGLMFYNRWGQFEYSYGLASAPDAADYKGSSWIRSGRQAGGKTRTDDHIYFARVDYMLENLGFVGASYVGGNSSQNNDALGDASLGIWEVHFQLQKYNTRVSGVYAQGSMSDTEKINTATGEVLGKETEGYYVTVEHDLLPYLMGDTEAKLMLFGHYNFTNLHKSVESSLTKDPTLEQTAVNYGINYYPIRDVVLKIEHERLFEKEGDTIDSTKLGIGYIF